MSAPAARQVSVVTGGASGIGLAVARRLATDGHDVHLVDRDPDLHVAASDLATRTGSAVTAHVHDLIDVAGAEALVDRIAAPRGLHVVVNSAGVSLPRASAQLDEQSWDAIFTVNVKGLFFLTRAALELMRAAGGGSVVSLSSISGKGWSGASSVAYAASKAAIVGMTRALAREYGGHGIRVNCVCPGITRTPMMEHWAATRAAELGVDVERFVADRVADSALQRASTTEDIAAAVAFLASPAAGNITGQSLNVDGGTIWD
ncbi:MAG: hypothetical protein ABS81_02595 [Pseudonocardia sp. SCN 72-86]|nr:MAG: hypothetical protein ABS81_02595 [Pseudonocardia sp. SCN 72-86]